MTLMMFYAANAGYKRSLRLWKDGQFEKEGKVDVQLACVKGGAKVRRGAGRTKSAAPSERLAENVCRMAASVAARMDIRQEAPRCTATWINGLTFVAAFWSKV